MTDSVSIGGQPYTVGRFKSFKAILAGVVLEGVTDQIKELVADAAEFRREHRASNVVQISRQQCQERINGFEAAAASVADDVPSAEFVREQLLSRAASWRWQLEDMGDRPYVELPQEPSDELVALALFPKAFKMRDQLTQLIALMVMPNANLLEGWREDTIERLLREKGTELLAESEPHELVELALVAKRVMGDQFRPLAGPVRELLTRGDPPAEKTPPPKVETPSTSEPPSEQPTSSTNSPPPTDGQTSSLSSESTGPLPVG